jgi:hypothetical protein
MSLAEYRRFRPRRRWIWAIVALGTAAVLVTPVALRFGLKADLQHDESPATVYHRVATAVQVSAPGGTVYITGGQPGRVTVASTTVWLFAKPAVSETWRGTTLTVSMHCPAPDLFEDCAASLTVQIPATAAVRAAVGSGTATITGLAGPVRVTTTSGSLTLADLSGPVWAAATSGSITGVSRLNSPKLTADVGSGSLALSLDSAPSWLWLAVGSGSGQVTVPAGTRYRVDSGAGSQAARVSPGLSSPGSARLITAEVGAGSLSIGYRPALGHLTGR